MMSDEIWAGDAGAVDAVYLGGRAGGELKAMPVHYFIDAEIRKQQQAGIVEHGPARKADPTRLQGLQLPLQGRLQEVPSRFDRRPRSPLLLALTQRALQSGIPADHHRQ